MWNKCTSPTVASVVGSVSEVYEMRFSDYIVPLYYVPFFAPSFVGMVQSCELKTVPYTGLQVFEGILNLFLVWLDLSVSIYKRNVCCPMEDHLLNLAGSYLQALNTVVGMSFYWAGQRQCRNLALFLRLTSVIKFT